MERLKQDWPGIAFPGGHIELHESIQESVIREIKEETGLDIENIVLCGIKNFDYNNEKYVVFCYQTNVFSGELLKMSDEGTLSWMSIDELTEENVASTFLDMLPIFLKEQQELYYRDDLPEYY